MKILLVEDSPTDALLAQRALLENVEFRVLVAEQLSQALAMLRAEPFDVVLLDLGLPDCQGLDTLKRMYTECGDDVAIVVLTGNEDESRGVLALRAGGQDYLQKKHVTNPEMLRRCVLYANERRRHLAEVKRLQTQVEQVRKEQQQKRESDFWDALSKGVPMNISARVIGEQALRDRYPEIFESLHAQYEKILERSLEQRVKKVELGVSSDSEQMAQRLGFLKATPRDVVELHRNVVNQKMALAASLLKANAYQEEARLRIVELMGYLAMYYRNQPMGETHVEGV